MAPITWRKFNRNGTPTVTPSLPLLPKWGQLQKPILYIMCKSGSSLQQHGRHGQQQPHHPLPAPFIIVSITFNIITIDTILIFNFILIFINRNIISSMYWWVQVRPGFPPHHSVWCAAWYECACMCIGGYKSGRASRHTTRSGVLPGMSGHV